MKTSREKLRALAIRRLKAHNLGYIWNQSSEVVVFGSWSTGDNRPDSDLDLLIIGNGKRLKRKQLDIVVKTREQCLSAAWLGSELANHIARYGIWVRGKSIWRSRIFTSRRAIDEKCRLIRGRGEALARLWLFLAPPYREKHVRKLRRDFQRLDYLKQGKPVPPTKRLDLEWCAVRFPNRRIQAFASNCGSKRKLSSMLLFAPEFLRDLRALKGKSA